MKYTSTREDKELLNFKQVTLKGLASDGGLYVPKNWKQPNLKFSNTDITFEKTAYEIIKYFVGKSLDSQLLKKLISRSYKSFRNNEITTLKQLDKNNYHLLCSVLRFFIFISNGNKKRTEHICNVIVNYD